MSDNPLASIMLTQELKERVALLGIGNPLKGDDGVGPLLISRLKDKTRAYLFDCGEVPENYIGPIIESKPQTIIIVDASDWGARAGEVRLIKKEEIQNLSFSTHGASLRLFLDYIEKQLPSTHIVIIGIQIGRSGLAESLTPGVKACLLYTSDAADE